MPSATDPDRAEILWLKALKRHAGRRYVIAIFAPLVSGGLLVAQAYALAMVLSWAITGAVAPDKLLLLIGLVGALFAVRALVGLIGETIGLAAAERIKLALRRALFTYILHQPPVWGDGRSPGALSSVIVEQVDAIDGFFSRFYPTMVQAAILPIAFAAIVLPLDWLAALLFLVTAPLIPVFMALVGWGAQAATASQAAALSRLSGRFADRLGGIVTLKLFGRAEAESQAMHAASEELRERTMRVLRIAFLSSAVLEFFAALGVAGVALYVGLSFLGLIHVRGTPLPYEVGLFVLLMAPEVYQPLRLLAAHYHDRAAAKAAVSEIARQFGGLPALDEPAVDATHDAPQLAGKPCCLAVVDLTIRTPDGGRVIIDCPELYFPAGQSAAIVGESGIGKSTLLEALARLRPTDGDIRLNGVGYDAIDEGSFREAVAFLPQRPRLFHGTIADNIRLGKRDASDAEVRRAAELACIDDFSGRLPLGLDTRLGDGGLGLSGGQAQRIALARLFLRNPTVLLLDEPTAHLDAVTELRVLDRLFTFAFGRTMIVATHSATLAARCGLTLRLVAGGRVAASVGLNLEMMRGAA